MGWYKASGKLDQLVTTDDLSGVRDDKVQKVIADIKTGTLEVTHDGQFSWHHYKLYD